MKARSVFVILGMLGLAGCSHESPEAGAAGPYPLLQAAGMGDTDKVRSLLASGGDVNAVDESGRSAIFYACRGVMGHEVVDLLLKAGADVNRPDAEGLTPLHAAVLSGLSDEVVRKLLAAGASAVAADKDGDTALHLAADKRAEETVRLLLEAGADVNARNVAGQTPLYMAARSDNADGVRALVKAGADVAARDADGWSPLAVAADYAQWEAYDALREAGATEETWLPLHRSAIEGDLEEARQQLAEGAEVDARDRYGRTPLIWTAACWAHDVMGLLLEAGADVHARDRKQATALLEASRSGCLAAVAELLKGGASVHDRYADGWTALHVAASNGYAEVVEALLAAGAEVDARNVDGDTPLLLALHARSDEVARMLLDAGADVEATNRQGQCADDLAIHIGREVGQVIRTRVAVMREARLERILAGYAEVREGGLEPPAGMPRDTPRNVLKKMIRSMFLGDPESFRACFTGREEELLAIESTFEMMQVGLELRRAMLDAYGKEGWLGFQDSDGARLKIPSFGEEEVEDIPITVAGKEAQCDCAPHMPSVGRLRLVASDGGWRIEAASWLVGVTDLGEFREMMARSNAVLRDAVEMVGKPGMTAEDVDTITGRRMMQEVFGICVPDHR